MSDSSTDSSTPVAHRVTGRFSLPRTCVFSVSVCCCGLGALAASLSPSFCLRRVFRFTRIRVVFRTFCFGWSLSLCLRTPFCQVCPAPPSRPPAFFLGPPPPRGGQVMTPKMASLLTRSCPTAMQKSARALGPFSWFTETSRDGRTDGRTAGRTIT